ncbi:MAG: glycosyltransferase family 2 protein [Acidobacteriota bacterium]
MESCAFVAYILLALSAFALLESLYSLKGGLNYLRSFRQFKSSATGHRPPATLILPCKGIEPGLERNLRAYFNLDYPDFQLLLVTESVNDPCLPLLRLLKHDYPHVNAHLLYAGRASARGQKVHNLLEAVRRLRDNDRVIAFGDSDIRPHPNWLLDLIALLEDPKVGMSTGFRWYLPQEGNFASVLRSVWNAGTASLLQEKDCLFAWGGAMAIRREVFESSGVPDYWKNAVSDDYAISRAMHDHSLSIHFQPRCLSFSHEDCTLGQLLGWVYRQLCITRVYQPRLWKAAFITQALNVAVIWGGSAAILLSLFLGFCPEMLVLALMVAAIYLLGVAKNWLRVRAVRELFPEQWTSLRRYLHAYLLWGPLASLLSIMSLIRTLFSRDIEWRGIRYRMLSSRKTVVLR